MEMKNLFYSKFPEYVGSPEAEKAFAIFMAGRESVMGNQKESGNTLFLVSESKQEDPVSEILDYLNEARRKMSGNKSLRGFKKTASVSSMIKARIKEGNEKEDFFMVVSFALIKHILYSIKFLCFNALIQLLFLLNNPIFAALKSKSR